MSAATDRNGKAMRKINRQATSKANRMKSGTTGSMLKKSVSKGMGKQPPCRLTQIAFVTGFMGLLRLAGNRVLTTKSWAAANLMYFTRCDSSLALISTMTAFAGH